MKCNKVCYTKEKPEREIQKWQRAQEGKKEIYTGYKIKYKPKISIQLIDYKKSRK